MKLLVIVPDYPNEKSIAYQFVHKRVLEYKKYFDVDVFCYNEEFSDYYVFEGIKVYGGDKKSLLSHIENNNYSKYAFHFLNGKNAKFILKYLKNKRVFVWFHGTDSVSYKRRLSRINVINKIPSNPRSLIKIFAFIIFNKLRINYIKLLNKNCKKLTFVFVSNWNKNASEEDLKIKFNRFEIISNYVDCKTFKYKKKTVNDRLNVLSINNYSNLTYAGDITEKVILEFSMHKEFKNFNFSVYGQGVLFDRYTNNLKQFKNVKIYKKILNHKEISGIHDKNGVFLYPKRGDSQGVTRCEAMASGLVSIASDVEAISEFSPEDTTYLVKSVDDFIKAFKDIYNNPDEYLNKSENSSKYISEKCSYENTIKKEIDLIKEEL